MSIDEAIFNGAVSLIAALIGGCLALRGTRLAIKHEKEKDREAKEEQARPFFEMIDYDDSRISDANRIVLNFSKEDNYSKNEPTLSGFIINSSKVEFVIKKFTIDGEVYLPLSPEMIEKTMMFRVLIHLKQSINGKEVLMHIVDINHKERLYKTIYENNRILYFEEIEKSN